MYKNGEGVFQNLEKSYMWLILAAVNGEEKAPKARDLVKQQMRLDFSLGDVAVKRAEKAARQCYDSNYQDCGQ
jgi:TPR repeat protein